MRRILINLFHNIFEDILGLQSAAGGSPPKKKEPRKLTPEEQDELEWEEYLQRAEEELEEDYFRILEERANVYQECIKDHSDGNTEEGD